MYTIEDVKLSRPNPTYHIPEGATREYDREDIIRALESETQAAQEQDMNMFRRIVRTLWRKLSGNAADRTQSTGRGLPV